MIQSFYTNQDRQLMIGEKTDLAEWLNIVDPTDGEIETIVQKYKLPRNYISSVLDPDEVSRHEKLESISSKSPTLLLFLYPRTIINRQGYKEYVTRPFSIILTENMIITASKDIPQFISKMIENDPQYPINTKNQEAFILALARYISSAYIRFLKEINSETEKLESKLVHSTKNEQLFVLMALQKSLVYFDTAIQSNHPIFNNLKEVEWFNQQPENRNALHDVIVENNQAESMIHQSHQLLEQISDIFSSVISNHLSNIMKVLTSITIVLTIPTIIGSLWGMNVRLPLEDYPGAFWILSAATAGIGIVTAWVLRKKDYF